MQTQVRQQLLQEVQSPALLASAYLKLLKASRFAYPRFRELGMGVFSFNSSTLEQRQEDHYDSEDNLVYKTKFQDSQGYKVSLKKREG